MIPWKKIHSEQALEEALALSASKPVLLFKHSNRCSVSSMVLYRLEREWTENNPPFEPYFIDVINDRPVSNEVAQFFGVRHESPQALLIESNVCVYHASHTAISYRHLSEAIRS
jgi:bacillithiol system protein YtxJ